MEAETLLQKHKLFSEDVSTHTPIYHATIKFGDELIGKQGDWGLGTGDWGLGTAGMGFGSAPRRVQSGAQTIKGIQ